MQMWILDDQPCFFFHFALNAFFRRFSCLKLPTQTVPLPFMDVVGLFVSVNHQRFTVMFDVAEGGKDHARYCT